MEAKRGADHGEGSGEDTVGGAVRGRVSVVGLGEMASWARAVVQEVQGSTMGLRPADLGADIRGLQQAISALSAAQTVRIAQYAARDGVWQHVDRGIGHVNDFAGDDLAALLGMAPMTSTKRVHTAAKLSVDLPRTLRALADGDLDGFRAQIVADETILADHDTCAAVEEIIHPRIVGDTPGAARRRVRRALAAIDPEAVRLAAEKARVERHVRTREGEFPGMTQYFASLPAQDSAKCWAAIDELAHRMRADDPARTIDQCRADALVDLILARAEVITTLTVAVPAHLFDSAAAPQPGAPTEEDSGDRREAKATAGESDEEATAERPDGGAGTVEGHVDTPGSQEDQGQPSTDCRTRARRPFSTVVGADSTGVAGVEIPGIGIITSEVSAALARSFGTKIRRMLVDSETGGTCETRSQCYTPSASVRAFVQARDGTCRFPGCRVKARRCQLDHVVSWPDGPTEPANLMCLCTHHHRLKTSGRWRPVLHPDGSLTWTDPFGDTWITYPVDHLDLQTAS